MRRAGSLAALQPVPQVSVQHAAGPRGLPPEAWLRVQRALRPAPDVRPALR
ncbi:MAG: hypothetical protein ABWY64_13815 [Tardiphaga sp.]